MQPDGRGLIGIGDDTLEYRWIPPAASGLPTLVFLHEGLGCIEIWKDFPDRVAAETRCGALIYSRRGYGGSSPVAVSRPLSYLHEEAVEILPRVLDRFGLDDVVLIGHSDGASIALIAASAAASKADRGRIQKVIVEAPHVFVEDVTIAGIEAAREAYRDGDLRTRLQRLHGDNVDCAFYGWNSTWLQPAFRDWNIEALLPTIAVPLLVIQGTGDEYATAAQYDAIAAQSGGPVQLLIPDPCGHTPHRDQAGPVCEAMVGFIRS